MLYWMEPMAPMQLHCAFCMDCMLCRFAFSHLPLLAAFELIRVVRACEGILCISLHLHRFGNTNFPLWNNWYPAGYIWCTSNWYLYTNLVVR